MIKFKVNQLVQCEVSVCYTVYATTFDEAAKKVAANTTPTCVDGRDFEIISDGVILSTEIERD